MFGQLGIINTFQISHNAWWDYENLTPSQELEWSIIGHVELPGKAKTGDNYGGKWENEVLWRSTTLLINIFIPISQKRTLKHSNVSTLPNVQRYQITKLRLYFNTYYLHSQAHFIIVNLNCLSFGLEIQSRSWWKLYKQEEETDRDMLELLDLRWNQN